MNNSSLPTEVLESIIDDFILEYAHTARVRAFLPRWYLIPLLRVCRLWHAVTEKYLYQSVAVGSNMHNQGPVVEGETRYDRSVRIHNLQMTHPKRSGHKIAEDLLRTLAMSTRLASLVKTLWLGLEPIDYPGRTDFSFYREWTRTNISILQLCPNINRLEIRGFDQGMSDSLLSVLKDKSLASFLISPIDLSLGGSTNPLSMSELFDVMQKWPSLRSITTDLCFGLRDQGDRPTFDAVQVAHCCPELREITFIGHPLFDNDLKVLVTMCSGVSRLEVSVLGRDYESLDALCDCLRVWSSTLEYLSLNLHSLALPLYQPLSEVLSTLSGLRELVLLNMRLEVDAISDLPQLERLSCSFHIGNDSLTKLSRRLRDAKKFPSLKFISIAVYPFLNSAEGRKEVVESCIDRKVDLRWVR